MHLKIDDCPQRLAVLSQSWPKFDPDPWDVDIMVCVKPPPEKVNAKVRYWCNTRAVMTLWSMGSRKTHGESFNWFQLYNYCPVTACHEIGKIPPKTVLWWVETVMNHKRVKNVHRLKKITSSKFHTPVTTIPSKNDEICELLLTIQILHVIATYSY